MTYVPEPGWKVVRVPIRPIKVVVDLEDAIAPEVSLEEFERAYGCKPTPPRFKIINIEVLTCPDDGVPILATECGRHPRFIKRLNGYAYFYVKEGAEYV